MEQAQFALDPRRGVIKGSRRGTAREWRGDVRCVVPGWNGLVKHAEQAISTRGLPCALR